MSFIAQIAVQIFANALAILAAKELVSGFIFHGTTLDLVIAAAVLGIVNSLIRPVVKLFTFPFIILTLGIFSLIINIAMLYLVADLLPTLQIHGFWAAFWGMIIISIVNNLVSSVFKNKGYEK
jgi:putative membrane protein